jgi:toluene monooxygenase system protein E
MSEPTVLKPLKTWSHLAGRRRRPSEYEIVSVNLHYSTDNPDVPWEQDPNLFMNRWYRRYRNESPLRHDDWNAFRDPGEVVYRTYNMLQDGQEAYVYGLFDQFSEREHDKSLEPAWADRLARIYTPARFPFHALQMASAYVSQMAPASTLTNCLSFQTADSLRWLSHTAYRTKELSLSFPDRGLARDERSHWERDAHWGGFRELLERLLVTWDWAEAFTALNLVTKPAIEEAMLRRLGEAARQNGDTLLGMLTDAQMSDAQRHRRWASALVTLALEKEGNREVFVGWIDKWRPLADAAIDAYCESIPEVAKAADAAKRATREFRTGLGL